MQSKYRNQEKLPGGPDSFFLSERPGKGSMEGSQGANRREMT